MGRNDKIIEDAAIEWLLRQNDPGFTDWAGFETWLAAAPDHGPIYRAVAMADRAAVALLTAAPRAAPVSATPRTVPRRAWLGGGLAASLAVAAGLWAYGTQPMPFVIETAAGRPRTMTLADGTGVALNGGTRLVLDRHRPRHIVMTRGEAVFTVIHDATRPFEIVVGDATISDVGTVFNVIRTRDATEVAVAQGEVAYHQGPQHVRLSAGRSLRAVDRDTRLVIGEIEPGVIGAWRTGRLVYSGTSLTLVAEDLSRNLGLTIVASPDLAGRRFRGVISFGANREVVIGRLGPLLGVQVRRDGAVWRLSPRTG